MERDGKRKARTQDQAGGRRNSGRNALRAVLQQKKEKGLKSKVVNNSGGYKVIKKSDSHITLSGLGVIVIEVEAIVLSSSFSDTACEQDAYTFTTICV